MKVVQEEDGEMLEGIQEIRLSGSHGRTDFLKHGRQYWMLRH